MLSSEPVLSHRCYFVMVIFFAFSTTLPVCECHRPSLNNFTDLQALLSFKDHLSSDPCNVLGDWNTNTSFCNWIGVSCSKHRQRVTILQLFDSSLQGIITPFLGNLSFLRLLSLANNSFHGHIPTEIGQLCRLKLLTLNINQMNGEIPQSIGNCEKLKVLSLSYNGLVGTIPNELGLLRELKRLYLGRNYITGTIPPSLENLTRLEELALEENQLCARYE
ncbi:hypothetical protein AMTR_s00135p00046620 [Amborella trichopoda]|uniref:Uncharacterized protein n=1 Tax=Amborella trichopoda TaxID=13333 RepID=W1P5K9_AMBTC|nr:hypothetical protein AMTR_s00135p00046620 [Amborella trichopoda]